MHVDWIGDRNISIPHSKYIAKYCRTISSQLPCIATLWSLWQMWNWLHPCSNDSTLCQCSPTIAFTPSTGTVDFITRDFHKLKSRQHSQTNRCRLHTLSLTSKTLCMQRISFVDVLLTTKIFFHRCGCFGGHTGWSQVQLSSVAPLWCRVYI